MRPNAVKQLLRAGEPAVGTWLSLGNVAAARFMARASVAKKNRITHRIPITDVKEIDAEVKKWLRAAYERDA